MAFINLVRKRTQDKEESQGFIGWCVLPNAEEIDGVTMPHIDVVEESTSEGIAVTVSAGAVSYEDSTGGDNTLIEYPDMRCFDVSNGGENPYTPIVVGGIATYDGIPWDKNLQMNSDYGEGLTYFVPPVWYGITLDSKGVAYNGTGYIPLWGKGKEGDSTYDSKGDDVQQRYQDIIKAIKEDFKLDVSYPTQISCAYWTVGFNMLLLKAIADSESDLPKRMCVCIGDFIGEYSWLSNEVSIAWKESTSETGTYTAGVTIPQGDNSNQLSTEITNEKGLETAATKYIGVMFPEWYPLTWIDYA